MITLPQSLADMKDSSSVFFIDLYVLHLATGNIYLSACDTDVKWYIPYTGTPVTYIAQPIERGDFKQSVDDKVDNVDIRISNATDDFSSALFNSFDFRGSDVDIIQIAYPASLNDPLAFKHVFCGYMDNPSLDMKSATFQTSLKAKVPNMQSCRSLMLSCNAWFGDPDECGITLDSKTSTLAAECTQTIFYDSSRTEGTNYWKNGVVTIGFESKKVVSSANGSITVEYPFFSAPKVGTSYTVTNGCDKSKTDCIRHGNLQNYSGFMGIPFEYQVKT